MRPFPSLLVRYQAIGVRNLLIRGQPSPAQGIEVVGAIETKIQCNVKGIGEEKEGRIAICAI